MKNMNLGTTVFGDDEYFCVPLCSIKHGLTVRKFVDGKVASKIPQSTHSRFVYLFWPRMVSSAWTITAAPVALVSKRDNGFRRVIKINS